MRSETNGNRRASNKNAGMSLVEVLVAIIILTVSLMAFFSSFIATAVYDKQARDKQRALKVAEGFMEGYKAYSLEEIYTQYANASDSAYKLYTGVFSSRSVTPVNRYDFTKKKFERSDDNKYVFNVDVEYDGESYGIKTTVTPAAKGVEVNRKDTQLTDKYEDAICVLKDNIMNDYAAAEAAAHITSLGEPLVATMVDQSKIRITEKKNIFNITGSDLKNAKIKLTTTYKITFDNYEYMVGGATYTTNDTIGPFTIDSTLDVDYAYYDNTSTGDSILRSIYVYFYPEFTADETFTFNNSINDSIDVYLIKQKPVGLTGMALTNAESTYTTKVVKAGTGHLYLHTNILKRFDGGTYTGNPATDIIAFANSNTFVNGQTNLLEDLSEDKVKVPMVYDVVVEVTDKNSGNVLYTLNGSMNSD